MSYKDLAKKKHSSYSVNMAKVSPLSEEDGVVSFTTEDFAGVFRLHSFSAEKNAIVVLDKSTTNKEPVSETVEQEQKPKVSEKQTKPKKTLIEKVLGSKK